MILNKPFYCTTINIRQSGSRIYEFSLPFKTFFQQLQTLEEKKEHVKSLKLQK